MKRLIYSITFLMLLLCISEQSTAQLGSLKKSVSKSVKKDKKETTSTDTKKEVIEDDGIPHDIHKNNVEQMLWSNEKISFTAPDEAKFKTTFSVNDYVYGRFYLSKSLQAKIYEKYNTKKTSISLSYDLYVNGVKQSWIIDNPTLYGDKLKWTSQQVWIYIADTEKSTFDKENWVKIVNALPPGEHHIKVDLKVSGYDDVFASGSFKLDKKEGEALKFGKTFADINAGMQDAALETKILSCISKHANQQDWEESFQKIKIKSEDWTILRNDLTGAILGRRIHAYCYATRADGNCSIQVFSFKQEYNGSGYNESIKFKGVVSGTQETIDCDAPKL